MPEDRTGLWPAWWWQRSPRVPCEDCGMEVPLSRTVTVDYGVTCDVCWFDGPGGATQASLAEGADEATNRPESWQVEEEKRRA